MKRTNRILPVYSADISGVCSALYELGGMTVMHDASGCNSTYTTHDEPRWYSMDSMVYISALSELEAVMGDDVKLVRDIVDAAKNLHPRFICIGGTPIPMMMGTDFRGIARMIEDQTGIPAFGIATNGMHSYVQGAGQALWWIAKRFCPPAKELRELALEKSRENVTQKTKTAALRVNILGVTPLDFSLTGNTDRLKGFLSEQGMETVSCWAMGSTLDEMCMAGLADVNLVVSAVGLAAARELRKIYGTPYVAGTPLGKKTSLRLAQCIRAAAETGENRSLFEDSCEQDGGLNSLSGKKVLIIGEQIISNSLRCCLKESLGADQVTVLCPTEGDKSLASDGDVLDWDEDEVIALIAQSGIVVADPLYRQVCPADKNLTFVDFPHEACSGRMYHTGMKPFVWDPLKAEAENLLFGTR